MLPKDLAIYACDRGQVFPDRLLRRTHAHYAQLARRLIELYRRGAGQTRAHLHRQAERVFQDEHDCPPQRIRALIRLVDRKSEYESDAGGRALRLRRRVFGLAAGRHPLVQQPDALFQHCADEVRQMIAEQIGLHWPQIEVQLYADFPEYHRLRKFDGYAEPADLLRRYNVAQAQTLLFWAEEMTITARSDFKRILRNARLRRLMIEAECPEPGQYRLRLTGPASLLRQTRRYGVDLAGFLAGLLNCRDWELAARLRLPSGVALFRLSSSDQLGGQPDSEEVAFDSEIERAFAEKFGVQRDGWHLQREGGLLVRGQKVFVPDFAFRHDDGTEVYLEIVGYWTPEYLEAKWKTLALFPHIPIIVAVPKSTASRYPDLPDHTIVYGSRLTIKPVLQRLASMRDDSHRAPDQLSS